MSIVQDQLAAAVAERNRIEAEAWARIGSEVPFPSDREKLRPYLAPLEASMETAEWKRWRAICITIEEIEKHRV